jgi:hypothetical protein
MYKENGDFIPNTKADKRAEERRKKKHEPTGGGFSAQAKRAEINKRYEGVPKALKPKVRVRVMGEEDQEDKQKKDKKKKL